MPSYRYIGTDARVWPDLSLSAEPGETIDADENPDPNWFEDATGTKNSVSFDTPAPTPEPAPADPAPEGA